MTKKTFFILLFLAFCAFFLRTYLFPSHLFFGPEQGKDFLVIRDIVLSHKWTLIGPKTDLSGVFHGPIYYYLATFPFAFSGGNPLWVMYFMSMIQALTVYPVYLLGKELSGKSRTGIIASILFTFSFGLVVYSRWLSGQPLTLPLTALFYFTLMQFLKGKRWYLLLTAISFGLAGQAEFINFLLLGITGAVIVLYQHKQFLAKNARSAVLVSFFVMCLFSVGNFALFDLRHDFLITHSLQTALFGGEGGGGSLVQSLVLALGSGRMVLADLCGLPFLWMAIPVFLLVGVCLWIERKQRNLVLMMLGIVLPFLTLVVFRRGVLDQVYLPMLIPFLVCLAYAVDRVYEKKHVLGVGLVGAYVCSNLYCILTFLPSNHRVFFQAPQPFVRYTDQLEVVQDIYARAGGKPFGIQSYTIPYFWQDGWTYLFWWQGSTQHGYIPKEEDDDLLYVIIQKDRANPDFQRVWYDKTVSGWGTVTYTFEKGEYRVEERQKDAP